MFAGREAMAQTGKSSLKKIVDRDYSSFFFCKGGLAIAVPGELRAYKKAYDEFGGGVSWRHLFQPTIELCRNGFVVSASQAAAIEQTRNHILADPILRFICKYFSKYIYLHGFVSL